jgi:hypothetical protein
MGVTWVRVDVRWNTVAPTRPIKARVPGSRGYDWASVDLQLRAIHDLQLTGGSPSILLSVGGTPEWARADNGAGGRPGDPAWTPRRTAFQNFVAAVVARYAGVVAAYEIWPNPNLSAGLRPQRLAGRLVAPGLLRVLTRVATAEIRKATSVPVVTGGLARTDTGSAIGTPSRVFLRAMGRTRIVADGIGVRLVPTADPDSGVAADNLTLDEPSEIVEAVDAAFPQHQMSIWESGYAAPSAAGDATPVPAVSTFLAAASSPRFAVSIWSSLIDGAEGAATGLFTRASSLDATTAKGAWTTWVARG